MKAGTCKEQKDVTVIVFSNLDSGATKAYRYSRKTIKEIFSDIMTKGDFYINSPAGDSTVELVMDIIPDLLMDLDKPGDSMSIYDDADQMSVYYEIQVLEVLPNF